MCTFIILYRPEHSWPILIAANRDEMLDRPWLPPGRHWPNQPNVIAGLDQLGGGSWFGLNNSGLASGVMNRRNTLGPVPGKRTRGELVLHSLDYSDAKTAAAAMAHANPTAYRAFNLIIADSQGAYWLCYSAVENKTYINVMRLQPGLSMITAYDCNDTTSPRIRRYLPQFLAAPTPIPEKSDWSAWKALLACRDYDPDAGPAGAINVVTDHGFGTTSSQLLALPSQKRPDIRPRWLFSAGRPDKAPFQEVML
jgi:uncharacterized protein with NRDE domain